VTLTEDALVMLHGAFLPFESGFLIFVAVAEQDGITRIPIVPVGR
jgi:hypothetical protein